jgi:parallel beta-helix repeat protein
MVWNRWVQVVVAVVLFGAVALVSLPEVEANGTVYYVSPAGNDSHAGTLQRPWRTIAKANQELRAGDTVYVRAGTYDEYIEPSRSGADQNKITYARYENERVFLRGERGTAKLVVLRDRDNIVVDGFTLSYTHPPPGGDKRWPWVFIGNGSEYNEIRNCTIRKSGDPLELFRDGYLEYGILLSASSHNIIEGNHIEGVNQGIHLKNAPRYNLILDNTIGPVAQSPIVVGSSKGILQGNLIEGNILEDSAVEDGIQFMEDSDLPHGNKRRKDVSNLGTIIRGNIIRNNAENAIDLKGAAHVVIENNVMYGTVGSSNGSRLGWNRNALATVTRGSNTTTRDVVIRNNVIYDSAPAITIHQGYKVYHNTLVANNRDYAGPDSDWTTPSRPAFHGIRQKEPGAGGMAIQNNIVVNHNTVEVALILVKDQERTNHIDHNLYYNTGATYLAHVRKPRDWSKLSLGQWQQRLQEYDTVTGNDESSIVADPMFVDVPQRPVGVHTQFDFELSDGSPAIDAGGPLTWTRRSGSGQQVPVVDAGYFVDGYGVTSGDMVVVGGEDPVRIIAVDYERAVITVERSLAWTEGAWVSMPYSGAAPDMGAYEFGGEPTRPEPQPIPSKRATPQPIPSKRVTPQPVPTTRATEGPLVLYTFEEGSGTAIHDLSGIGVPLDLSIEDPTAVRWSEGAISIRSATAISSQSAATKVAEACRATNEVSLEAWFRPANTRQDGPARIVTISAGTRERNLTLGQGQWSGRPKDVYDTRLRTTEQSLNGRPSLLSQRGSVLEALTHMVFSRAATGKAVVYVNGEIQTEDSIRGDLSNWDDGFPLVLGNEPTGDRPWLGELYLVAVYCRALSHGEVERNYAAGEGALVRP